MSFCIQAHKIVRMKNIDVKSTVENTYLNVMIMARVITYSNRNDYGKSDDLVQSFQCFGIHIMIKNNYLDDLTNQDMYLRPQDSNSKTSNKYLKTE